jgi:hypothetical protein
VRGFQHAPRDAVSFGRLRASLKSGLVDRVVRGRYFVARENRSKKAIALTLTMV